MEAARLYRSEYPLRNHIGGFGVGVVVILLGIRIMRDTVLQLMDTMPDEAMLNQIRRAALQVPGALAIEKCRARKTGMKYHVDLHLEVDPNLTVQASHDIATQVRIVIKESLDWVADVLVHVEPYGLDHSKPSSGSGSLSDGRAIQT